MNRSTDRILTTHAGSLIRPLDVIEGMKAKTLGDPFNDLQFERTIDSAITAAVRRQVEIGVDIPSDGEYARPDFKTYINERIMGLQPFETEENANDRLNGPRGEWAEFPGFYSQYYGANRYEWMPPEVDLTKVLEFRRAKRNVREGFYLSNPVQYSHTAVERDIKRLTGSLAGLAFEDAFISAVTPTTDTGRDIDFRDFYADYEEYQHALADALREEYQAIIAAGFIVQLDRPGQDPTYQLEDEREIVKTLEAGIEVVNYALRSLPTEQIRIHWCAGSGNRPHTQDVAMAAVARTMLKLNAGAYGFEAANPRHEHEWRVWEEVKLPEGKILIPGVVSQSTNVIEHPELIAWRIENFARLVGRENVIAGVDCGFSQGWDIPRTHWEVQWGKLRALVEGAQLASQHLWGAH